MVVIFSLLLRMTKAVIKTGAFPEVSVPVPDALVVVGLCIRNVEDANSVRPHTDMAEADSDRTSGILLWCAGNLENKILVRGNIRISTPWTNAIAGNTGAAYVNVVG